MLRWCKSWLAAHVMLCMVSQVHAADTSLVIGSKQFTESVLLGEVATSLLQANGVVARHRSNLGGTRLLWEALLRGDIDVYPEYTGTLAQEVLADVLHGRTDREPLQAALQQKAVGMTGPLGFNNTYALAMLPARAAALHVQTISQLADLPALRLGFSSEFMARGDGWQSLQSTYRLPQQSVRGLEHDLAYRAIVTGELDVIDVYTTDAEVAYYKLQVLQDDKRHFPDYLAIILYRADLLVRRPEAVNILRQLEGRISQEAMLRMNRQAKFDKRAAARIAADFLHEGFGMAHVQTESSWTTSFWRYTAEHLRLVGISLLAAVIIGMPTGIACARWQRMGQLAIHVIAVLQTIPALALLVFMIPFVGIGDRPAILAIFIYSVLPIVRNTCSGLQSIPRSLIESAQAIGLPPRARLLKIELPLAARTIFAGIKTAAVINVGTATLGALVGAGGYGQPILTGIRLDDTALILQGAVPAALLAVAIQVIFDVIERRALPPGSR